MTGKSTTTVVSPGVRAVAALSRHAGVYGAGSTIGLFIGLVNAVVLTRFLAPSAFGILGLALVGASFLTIALNALIGPGALIRTFGATEDEVVAGTGVAAPPELGQRSFGSALVATAFTGSSLTLLATAAAFVVTERGEAVVIITLAAASGTLGGLWRLLSTVPRLQRRPTAYVLLATVRPLLVISFTLPLVIGGGGVIGALAGVAFGTAVANVVAAMVVRSTFKLCLDRGEIRMMLRRSRSFIPLIAGTWIIQNVDLYIVAFFASAAETGQYRLASRLGALASYGTSALLSAWGPLELSALFRDSDAAHGRTALRGAVLFHFLLLCLLLLLILTVAADQLVRVAPESYARAAKLLPALALAFVANSVLVAVYRAGWFRKRAPVFRIGTFLAGLAYVPLAVGLVALIGAIGAALAAVLVLTVVTLALMRGTHREGHRLGVPAARLALATALAAALYMLSIVVPTRTTAAEVLVHLAAPLLFLAAVPWFWPPSHRRSFVSVLRAALSRRSSGARD